MNKARILLILAGVLSFDISLFQAGISFSPDWSAAFEAGDELVSAPSSLLTAGLLMSAVFAFFGIYALSGAGLIRHLPLLRLGLLAIGLAYAVRGVPFLPQALMLLHVLPAPEPIQLQLVNASLVSLIAGILYLTGLVIRWKSLSPSVHDTRNIVLDPSLTSIKKPEPRPGRMG